MWVKALYCAMLEWGRNAGRSLERDILKRNKIKISSPFLLSQNVRRCRQLEVEAGGDTEVPLVSWWDIALHALEQDSQGSSPVGRWEEGTEFRSVWGAFRFPKEKRIHAQETSIRRRSKLENANAGTQQRMGCQITSTYRSNSWHTHAYLASSSSSFYCVPYNETP